MGSNGIYTIEDQNDDIADLANIIPLGGSTPQNHGLVGICTYLGPCEFLCLLNSFM